MQDITKKKLPSQWLQDPVFQKKTWDAWVEMAHDEKDKDALRFFMNRLLPGQRIGATVPPGFNLPNIDSLEELELAEKKTTDALNNQEITIAEAKDLFVIFHGKRQTIMMRDMQTDIDGLKDKFSGD